MEFQDIIRCPVVVIADCLHTGVPSLFDPRLACEEAHDHRSALRPVFPLSHSRSSTGPNVWRQAPTLQRGDDGKQGRSCSVAPRVRRVPANRTAPTSETSSDATAGRRWRTRQILWRRTSCATSRTSEMNCSATGRRMGQSQTLGSRRSRASLRRILRAEVLQDCVRLSRGHVVVVELR